MGTYNIYSYNNAADNDDPVVVVELNDDDTEIVNVTSTDPEQQEEAESVIRGYVENEIPVMDALVRYAGSYGQVLPEGADRDLNGDEDAVVSAAEGEPEPFTLPDGIMAMTEDNGTVVTLTKRDQEHGSVYRHDGEWKPLVDPSVLNGLAFVGVTASSEAIFDKYEADDKLVTIGHYLPSTEGPAWPDPVRIYDEPEHTNEIISDDTEEEGDVEDEVADEEAVTASISLNSASDLDNAISAALLNKDLQWYVERRVAALGLEAALPWVEG